MTTLSATALNLNAHRDAIFSWLNNSGRNWIYVAKMLLAMALAYWASMFLELASTRSAALTVLIVMQPQAGQVFAKSIARILGTILGLSATLTLVSLFHQQPVMFLSGTALWCGLCIAGAIRFRDMRAYVCLLSGYTVGMIGVPGAIDPDIATLTSVSRMLAVLIGIISGGLVSALIFPGTTVPSFKAILGKRLSDLCAHTAKMLRNELAEDEHETTRRAFAAQAVTIEALRQAASTENPELHAQKNRLISLNYQFMELGTRLHALAQLRKELREAAMLEPVRQRISESFDNLTLPILDILDELAHEKLTSASVARKRRQFEVITFATKLAIREQRINLRGQPEQAMVTEASRQQLEDLYETLSELLFRFIDQLRIYCENYAALSHPYDTQDDDEDERLWSFRTSVNPLHAITTGARSILVIMLISTFWISVGWKDGTMCIQNAIIAAVLTATAANPHRMAASVAQGAVLGFCIGFIISFFVLPHMDGFPLMMVAISPIFIIGTWLTLNPKYAGIGLGAMINFCFVSSPTNPATFLPQQFANNAVAGGLGMIGSAVLLSLLFPPSGRWLSRALIRDLRGLVAKAVTAPLPRLGARIDSQCRDLLNQTYNMTMGQATVQRELLDWHSSVQSVSHAIIELRELLTYLDNFMPQERDKEWRKASNRLGQALIRLYLKPGKRHYERAFDCLLQSISALRPELEPEDQHFEESPKRQAMSYLHFIGAALADRDGPFAEYRDDLHADRNASEVAVTA